MTTATDQEFDAFVRTCREAVGRQVSGRTESFQSLWSRADDVVLMGAAGSHQKGWAAVSRQLTWASQHLNFRNFTVENLLTCVSEDIAFTVDLKHMIREVNGQVEQRTLRASQGYRVEDDRWRVIFRHGDPMAEPTDPTQPPAK